MSKEQPLCHLGPSNTGCHGNSQFQILSPCVHKISQICPVFPSAFIVVPSAKDNQMPWEKILHTEYQFEWIKLVQEYIRLKNEDYKAVVQGKDFLDWCKVVMVEMKNKCWSKLQLKLVRRFDHWWGW